MRRPRTITRRRSVLLVLAIAVLAPVPYALGQESSTLRLAIPGDDGSLTPYTSDSTYPYMSLVYDTLMWRDAKGIPQPWLARSVSRDVTGLRVYVRLRPGVRWHDGRPLTSRDVAFTYQYMMQRAHPRFTPQLQDLVGVRTAGPLALWFYLRRRSLGFSDQPLADVPILPAHLWSDVPAGRLAPPGLAVGSGPYKLARHDRTGYRFTANHDYFKGTPSIDRLDVPVIDTELSATAELRSRKVDVVPLNVAPGTRSRRLVGVTFSDEISYSGTMLLFNVAKRPFSRRAARRAVARSLDLATIAGNATMVDGGTVPADHGMLHPASRWAPKEKLHRFDPRAARLAFAEQGIEPFRIAVADNDPVRLETARRIVRTLERLGARTRLLELTPRRLDRALGRDEERGRRRATFDAAVVGIPALASYDPAFLRAVFGDPRIAPLNDGNYRGGGFAGLASLVATANTERRRREFVHRQLRLLASDLPAVPLHFGGGTFAYRTAVYDRWISIRGTGILDKRSFLRGRAATPRPASGTPSTDLLDRSEDGGFSLIPAILVFLLLVLAGGIRWARRR